MKLGYIKVPAGLLVRIAEAANHPDDKIVILCTGSQGEENSALVRMSTGDHQHVKIKPSDTVIFSSSVIPGNEMSVVNLIDNLMREGANVYARSTEAIKGHGPVHVGGLATAKTSATSLPSLSPSITCRFTASSTTWSTAPRWR